MYSSFPLILPLHHHTRLPPLLFQYPCLRCHLHQVTLNLLVMKMKSQRKEEAMLWYGYQLLPFSMFQNLIDKIGMNAVAKETW